MGLEAFKNPFDLDGLVKPQPGVTEAKVQEAQKLLESARRSRVEEARMVELFTTSDLSFSVAHLLNINTIPQLPEELKSIDGIAANRVVRDFNPVVLRGLIAGGVSGAGINADGSAAVVPEGTPFPIVTVGSSEESFYQKLAKRGFRFDFTFESLINDLLGELDRLPDEFLKVTVDTIYAEIFDAIESSQTSLASATLLDGTTVSANSALHPLAVIAAVAQVEETEINGRKIGTISAWNLFVPNGQKRFFEYALANMGRVISVQDGSFTLGPDAAMQALFPNVTVVESPRFTGTAWAIAPKPGSTARPVLERLSLRGYETPELRVRNDQGFTPSGGKIGIWQGGFDADTASYRYRHITGAVLWDDSYVVKSTGAGALPTPGA